MKKPARVRIKDYKKLAKKAGALCFSESEKPLGERDDSLIDECVETILFCNEEIAQIRAHKKTLIERWCTDKKAFIKMASVFLLLCIIVIAGIILVMQKALSSRSADYTLELRIDDSCIFEEQEISSAMDVVISLFSKNWKNCRLKRLSYAGDPAIAFARKAGMYGNDYQVMVLNADFSTGNKKTVLYEPNTEYINSNWVLVKHINGKWIVRDIAKSEFFDTAEIRAATDAAIHYFSLHWQDCDLFRIGYAGDDAVLDAKHYGNYSANDKVLVLKSDFAVGSEADPSLEPNAVYTDWTWILVQDDQGEWLVQDCGY